MRPAENFTSHCVMVSGSQRASQSEPEPSAGGGTRTPPQPSHAAFIHIDEVAALEFVVSGRRLVAEPVPIESQPANQLCSAAAHVRQRVGAPADAVVVCKYALLSVSQAGSLQADLDDADRAVSADVVALLRRRHAQRQLQLSCSQSRSRARGVPLSTLVSEISTGAGV